MHTHITGIGVVVLAHILYRSSTPGSALIPDSDIAMGASLVLLLISQSVANALKECKHGLYLAETEPLCHERHKDGMSFLLRPLLHSHAIVELCHCSYRFPQQAIPAGACEGRSSSWCTRSCSSSADRAAPTLPPSGRPAWRRST